MPAGIPIKGDDVVWKRKVDQVLMDLQNQINILKSQVAQLQQRSK